MSDKLVDEIMTTIRAIKEYEEKHGNTIDIDRYYKTFGTYKCIVDYLKEHSKISDKKS